MDAATTVSCPGKVLLAGGYTILERPNVGVVLCTDARFFSSVRWTGGGGTPPPDCGAGVLACIDVDVSSPQFRALYEYRLTIFAGAGAPGGPDAPALVPRHPDRHRPNPYVEGTLRAAVGFAQLFLGDAALRAALRPTLEIRLRADNDFYSQLDALRAAGLPPTPTGAASLPRFAPCPAAEGGGATVVKTGMGSSAALVSSLAGALLRHLGAAALPHADGTAPPDATAGRTRAHNLAQLCHTLAQGKVGSGFDVSAAAYGSQAYVRLSPGCLAGVLASESAPSPAEVHACVTDGARWDTAVAPLVLPPGVGLLLADVRGGSETPSMVRRVLAWRRDGGPEATQLWDGLVRTNRAVHATLARLASFLDGEEGAASIRTLSALDPSGWRDLVTDVDHQFSRLAVAA
eukprot:CAMPEP_0194274634 /NCGR_PEP_ID=MMETSP0169-20130528/7669_1 /TAXON_ID=218684 /ORGANISM="Corethron pennatum, Strain L29A3" /LENGTH=403 /DNA_ID=CAMNT_0039017885 /DNA_START=75 /DNA_END=1282 /DNA_ORIENTATION=-